MLLSAYAIELAPEVTVRVLEIVVDESVEEFEPVLASATVVFSDEMLESDEDSIPHMDSNVSTAS